ncbi:MAG: hypothetical protein ABFD96_03695 [Armatimonadia bacterium]
MRTLPMTEIGGRPFSRVLCGSNMFFGHSHFSAARSNWLRKYFSVDRIVEVMCAAAEEGVNGTISMPLEDMAEAIRRVKKLTGVDYQWIATPGATNLQELMEGIKYSAEVGAAICMPHVMYTDNHLVIGEKKIIGAEEIFAYTRELGMGTGWSTHRPETIVVSDAAGYDCDTYVQPFNSNGFLCSVETDWVGHVIRNAKNPVVCIKPLAAGRIMPPTGLQFVYHNCKPNDTVAIGFLSPEEVEEDIKIVRWLLEGSQEEVALQETRSKAGLKAG